ncbi:MAG: amino acid permease [Rhodothermales bacterium]
MNANGSSQHSRDQVDLVPVMGLTGALALGIGTMIAAGIFVLSGLAVSMVGAVAILSFVLAGLVVTLTAAAYAEFASIYPESGGEYAYVANTFDSNLTYLLGWTMILGYPASAAFYLTSFSDWFYHFIHPVFGIPETIPFWVSGLVMIALLVAVNFKGTKESTLFQIVFTATKVVLLIIFLYGGLRAMEPSVVMASIERNIGDLAGIGTTSALVFITFFGFSAIAASSEDIRSPGRTVPRAIYISMAVVTVLYALVVLVVVVAVNDPAFLTFLSERVDLGGLDAAEYVTGHGEVAMGLAAQYYLGDVGFYVIIVGALISMVSAANATIIAGSRVKLAMARRDHLPRHFRDLHPRLRTPHKTVLLTGGIILFYVVVFGILFARAPGSEAPPLFGLEVGLSGIAQYANYLLLCGLITVNIALIWSRRTKPDLERGFRVPFVPVIPILAILANLGLLLNLGVKALVLGILAQAVGVLFWFFWRARPVSSRIAEEETPTAVAEYAGHPSEERILVAISNPAHIARLMRTGMAVARDRGGQLLVMSAVIVPDQTPLSEGRGQVSEQRKLLEEAIGFAEGSGLTVTGTIRIAHRVADAVLNTIDQHDCDAVIVGWRGETHHRRDIILGSNLDDILDFAPCDVLVERIGEQAAAEVSSILVPVAGGPHSDLSVAVARSMARETGARVVLYRVLRPGDEEPASREALEAFKDAFVEVGIDVELRLEASDNVEDALVAATEKVDLTVLGATREPLISRLVAGDLPEAIARRGSGMIIMARRNIPGRSRIRRWLRTTA